MNYCGRSTTGLFREYQAWDDEDRSTLDGNYAAGIYDFTIIV